MKETQQTALAKLGEITELGADKNVVAALGETVKNIDDMIKSLGSAARERLDIVALHDKQYDALRGAQTGFVAAASPAMLDAQTQLNAVLGSANPSPTTPPKPRAPSTSSAASSPAAIRPLPK